MDNLWIPFQGLVIRGLWDGDRRAFGLRLQGSKIEMGWTITAILQLIVVRFAVAIIWLLVPQLHEVATQCTVLPDLITIVIVYTRRGVAHHNNSLADSNNLITKTVFGPGFDTRSAVVVGTGFEQLCIHFAKAMGKPIGALNLKQVAWSVMLLAMPWRAMYGCLDHA